MNGSIKERIIKKGQDKHGKIRTNLKVYDVYYRYNDPITGKNNQTSKKGFRTKAEAEAYLLDVNTRQATSTFIPIKNLTVREYLQDWLKNYAETHLRQNTAAGYRSLVEKHILPIIGNIDLQKLNASHIDNLYALKLTSGRLDGKGGLAPKSVMYIHRVLHEALEHAAKKQIIFNNPVKRVTNTPKLRKYKGEIYSPEEIRSLLKAAKDTDWEVPISLAAICGMRRGEILGLRKTEINLDTGTIKISKQLIATNNGPMFESPKSEDSNRIINAPIEVLDMINLHITKQEKKMALLDTEYKNYSLLVCKADGNPIDPRIFSKNFSKFLSSNQFKHIRFHDLRHSCATLMLNSGVPLKVASQILGHSTIGITADLYTHVIDNMKKDAAIKVGSEIFGNNTTNSDNSTPK
ncbi:site-specific integrase [Propionispora vibrioides]|uniref:Integrase n=1 Tax=Propionispora vibrioides TaxID=112903 RepID=A0A1H8U259_9FIRM|nr:site-specific integrase [Propionispora vibrioides]SEO97339.1 integrase [Propionispora vibrioides]